MILHALGSGPPQGGADQSSTPAEVLTAAPPPPARVLWQLREAELTAYPAVLFRAGRAEMRPPTPKSGKPSSAAYVCLYALFTPLRAPIVLLRWCFAMLVQLAKQTRRICRRAAKLGLELCLRYIPGAIFAASAAMRTDRKLRSGWRQMCESQRFWRIYPWVFSVSCILVCR